MTTKISQNMIGDQPNQSFLSPLRNKLINGNMDIAQRSTSQTANGYGSLDRWSLGLGGTSTCTLSRQQFGSLPTELSPISKYFMRCVVVSGNTTSSSVSVYQRIESVRTLAGKTVTVSFYAKADANKNLSVELAQNFGTTGSLNIVGIGATKFNITTAWTKYKVSINLPTVFDKTIDYFNDFLQVRFWLDAGSLSDDRSAVLGNQSGTFDIMRVQLEEGTVATEFEDRHPSIEKFLCNRYFEVISEFSSSNSFSGGNGMAYATIPFIEKRAIPTVTLVSGTVLIFTSVPATAATEGYATTTTTKNLTIKSATSGAGRQMYVVSAKIEFDSEL